METFGVKFTPPGGAFAGGFAGIPEGLEFVAESWSADIERGYDQATVRVYGPLESIKMLLTWPGATVEITSPSGTVVWAGIAWEVDASLGSVRATTNLDGVYNAVQVVYGKLESSGAITPAKTGWATNVRSQLRYGVRQVLVGMDEATEAQANAMRDEVLRRTAALAPVVTSAGDGKVGATLVCYGAYRRLDTLYFEEVNGEVAYLDTSGDEFPVSSFIVSTGIAFGAAAINPGNDDVSSVAGEFAGLAAGDALVFEGTGYGVLDNERLLVKSFEANNHIELAQFNATNVIPTMASGPPVTVSRGGEFYPATRIAGRFQVHATGGLLAIKGALKVGKVGTPAASLTVELTSDSGGNPGTVLGTATVTAAAVSVVADWVEFSLTAASPGSTALTAGVYYWLVLRCTANNLGNYYFVSLDSDMGGGLANEVKFYDGSGWRLRERKATMPLRVWEEQDSAVMLVNALAGTGLNTTVTHLSGRSIARATPEPLTVAEYVDYIKKIGTASLGRWGVYPDPEGGVIFRGLPQPGRSYALRTDGVLVHHHGGIVDPGFLPVGAWVEFPSLPTLDSGITSDTLATAATGVNALLVVAADYSAGEQRLSMRTEGAVDPWAALQRRMG